MSVLLIVCAFVTICLSTDKKFVLNFFIVDGEAIGKADLLVLLEGGSIRFSPTRERANKTIELYKQYPKAVLVCAYHEEKKGVIKYLVRNGITANDIVKSSYDYKGKVGGGTYNNVLEIISIIKKYNTIKNIVVVTSPYHELRVSLIFSELVKQAKIDRPVHVKYSHIENSEVIHTDVPRFISIIFHELMGIAWFYIKFVSMSLVKNIENVFMLENAVEERYEN